MFLNLSALLSSASSIVCALFHWQKGGRNTFNVPLNSTLQRSLLHSAPLFVQNTKIYVQKFSFSTIVKDNIPRTKCITLFAPRPKYFILENYNTDILKFLNRLKALVRVKSLNNIIPRAEAAEVNICLLQSLHRRHENRYFTTKPR